MELQDIASHIVEINQKPTNAMTKDDDCIKSIIKEVVTQMKDDILNQPCLTRKRKLIILKKTSSNWKYK